MTPEQGYANETSSSYYCSSDTLPHFCCVCSFDQVLRPEHLSQVLEIIHYIFWFVERVFCIRAGDTVIYTQLLLNSWRAISISIPIPLNSFIRMCWFKASFKQRRMVQFQHLPVKPQLRDMQDNADEIPFVNK